MLRKSVAGLVLVLVIGAAVLAEETRGTIVKLEDGSITIRTGGGSGGGARGRGATKSEEKTFKISKDVKISQVLVGKDKDEVKLTLDEVKTAVKVTSVPVTVVTDGDTVTELKVGRAGGVRRGGGGKKNKTDE